MAQVVKLKRSSVAGNTPGTGDMVAGELAMNTADGKLFLRDDSTVRPIVTTDAEITGSLNLVGNITASGNISGSLTGSFKHLKATTIEGNSPLIIKGVSDLTFADPGDGVTFSNTNLFGNPIFHGDINIYSGSAMLDEIDQVIFRSTNTQIPADGHLQLGDTATPTELNGDGITLKDDTIISGSTTITGSLTVRDADTTLRGTLNVKGEGSDTSTLKIGGNVNSGGSVRLDFKHHTTENNAGASIRSSGGSYGTGNLQFYAKGTNTSDGADLTSDNLIAKMSYTNGLEVYKNFSVLGGDLQFGHVGGNTSAEKRLGVRTDEPNSTQSSLHIEAGQATYSNRSGGNLRLKAGGGSGTGNSGVVSFFTCTGSLGSGEENTVLERARFTPNGEFGIGTTSPTEKLTVEGNISASGEIIGSINGGTF